MIETIENGMKFESFEEMESVGTNDAEGHLALCNKLGLKGQIALSEKGSRAVRFNVITREQAVVFETLFPTKVKLVDYDRGPIPMRVLEVAERAVEQGLTNLTVWCPETDQDKDPVLVGFDGTTHTAKCFLLARWGDALDEWPGLVAKFKSKFIEKLRAILCDVQGDISKVEAGGVGAVGWNANPYYCRCT